MLLVIPDKFHKFQYVLAKIPIPSCEILGQNCILIFTIIYLVLIYLEKKTTARKIHPYNEMGARNPLQRAIQKEF